MRRSPGANARGVLRRANITALLSERVIRVSGATVYLMNLRTGVRVPAVVTQNSASHVITLNPTGTLRSGTTYLMVVTSRLRDAAGNSAIPAVWMFTTGRK